MVTTALTGPRPVYWILQNAGIAAPVERFVIVLFGVPAMAVDTSEFDDMRDWTSQVPSGLEVLDTPADVQEQLEQIYMQREIRRLDEQLAFLHRQMFWMNAFQWGTYAIAVLAASILLMEFMSSR